MGRSYKSIMVTSIKIGKPWEKRSPDTRRKMDTDKKSKKSKGKK